MVMKALMAVSLACILLVSGCVGLPGFPEPELLSKTIKLEGYEYRPLEPEEISPALELLNMTGFWDFNFTLTAEVENRGERGNVLTSGVVRHGYPVSGLRDKNVWTAEEATLFEANETKNITLEIGITLPALEHEDLQLEDLWKNLYWGIEVERGL